MRYPLVIAVCFFALFSCSNEENNVTETNERVVPVDTLVIALQIGTDYGDSTYTFGMISDAAIDNDGNILVLDRMAADLKMYDNQGEYVRNVTRKGNGPGELVLPWDMFLFGDGRLMVLDPGKQGFVVFDDSLQFIEELELWQQNPPFQSCAVSDSQFASFKATLDVTETEVIIRRMVALYTYAQENYDLLLWQDSLYLPRNDVREDMSLLYNNLEEPLTICSDGLGIVYFSLRNGDVYSVRGWDIVGAEMLEISLDLPSVEKTMEEMKAESTYVTNYWASRGNVGPQYEFRPAPLKDMVISINIGPDGNLWVRRGTTQIPFFDIFDPADGELLRQAVFIDDGYSWKFEISRNGILAWEEDPEEFYQVLYQIQ